MNNEATPNVSIEVSRGFNAWMVAQQISLAFTTYQAGKIFLVGTGPHGQLSVFERTFHRPMGVAIGENGFWLSSLYQLWRFENFMEIGEQRDGYDALFVPVIGHTTGDIDIHDVDIDGNGQPIFIATRFNCIAKLSERGSFKEVWRPSFIDRFAAEDRCHLNGLAMREGRPAYVTCFSRANFFEGWRSQRQTGGVVLDVEKNEIIAEGLSMPHSPRLYNGKLWVLQTGTGELGYIDFLNGTFRPVAFLPGFVRGLDFAGNYAIVGTSRPRKKRTFNDLQLNTRLDALGVPARCGIFIVNLETGDIEHSLELNGVVEEIFDVGLIKGVLSPKLLGFMSDEIQFCLKPEPLKF